jgi:hypothetical protein
MTICLSCPDWPDWPGGHTSFCLWSISISPRNQVVITKHALDHALSGMHPGANVGNDRVIGAERLDLSSLFLFRKPEITKIESQEDQALTGISEESLILQHFLAKSTNCGRNSSAKSITCWH